MGIIKFVKEPGYVYNLFRIFSIYFNKKALAVPVADYKNSEEDLKYFESVLKDYLPISEELLPFFYMPRSNVSVMTRFYFESYRKEMVEGKYNLGMVLEALKDYEQVVKNVLWFYFGRYSEEKLAECLKSLKSLNQLIRASIYEPEVKNALYAFFIDPVPAIQKLSAVLVEKEALLAVQYEKKYSEVVTLQKRLNYDTMVADLKQIRSEGRDFSQYEVMYVSVGTVVRQIIAGVTYENSVVVVIGLDYLNYIEQIKDEEILADLNTFGNALSEKNRIEILEFILREGEVSQKTVEKELGLTPNNAYYHLVLMSKANILSFRHQGRATLYRINKEYLTVIRQEIEKYMK